MEECGTEKKAKKKGDKNENLKNRAKFIIKVNAKLKLNKQQ